MSKPPPDDRASPLLRNAPGRGNAVLARTFFNEMMKSGRSVSDLLEFVNTLLELVASSRGAAQLQGRAPFVDPETGYPTRQGFHALLTHELAPPTPRLVPAVLVLLEAHPETELSIWTGRIRHAVRQRDVVASLNGRRVGVVIFPVNPCSAQEVGERLERLFTPAAAAWTLLEPGAPPKALWRMLLQVLKRRSAPT